MQLHKGSRDMETCAFFWDGSGEFPSRLPQGCSNALRFPLAVAEMDPTSDSAVTKAVEWCWEVCFSSRSWSTPSSLKMCCLPALSAHWSNSINIALPESSSSSLIISPPNDSVWWHWTSLNSSWVSTTGKRGKTQRAFLTFSGSLCPRALKDVAKNVTRLIWWEPNVNVINWLLADLNQGLGWWAKATWRFWQRTKSCARAM